MYAAEHGAGFDDVNDDVFEAALQDLLQESQRRIRPVEVARRRRTLGSAIAQMLADLPDEIPVPSEPIPFREGA